ncbi:MAG: IS630 family transposase [Eubacteriaceae bacterium]|nr:IS630 family transposase [Eubacteriaceae bacterium]
MNTYSKYSKLVLSADDKKRLEKLSKSQTEEHRKVQRAKIILLCSEGMNNIEISTAIGVHRNTVSNIIKRYLSAGFEYAINDNERSGKPSVITDDEKVWIINLACSRPVDLGYAQELWTYKKLQEHIREHCINAGYPGLNNISNSTIHDILDALDIKPHRIRYYLEKRDPDFESKMHDVLLVYKQIELCFDEKGNLIPLEENKIVTISYDEKPGIQAIANTVDDLRPSVEHGFVGRDSEYKRLGTISFLAGMDLLTGEIIPLVRDTHKSSDFIEFLKLLDEKYPAGDKIRLVLDNHSAHKSKETNQYLSSRPGRFEFVFTPKHGSWLNLIESFFGKMTKQFLRGIRVKSKEELVSRIYRYINEVNASPVVYRWTYKMDEVML